MKKWSTKKYKCMAALDGDQSIEQLNCKRGGAETRMIISPPDSKGDTTVTLEESGKTQSVSMKFVFALEKLFTLKVYYYASGDNTEGDKQ